MKFHFPGRRCLRAAPVIFGGLQCHKRRHPRIMPRELRELSPGQPSSATEFLYSRPLRLSKPVRLKSDDMLIATLPSIEVVTEGDITRTDAVSVRARFSDYPMPAGVPISIDPRRLADERRSG